jgi:hypothetical protein
MTVAVRGAGSGRRLRRGVAAAAAAGQQHRVQDQHDLARTQHGGAGDAGHARQLRADVLDHHLAVAQHLVDLQGDARAGALSTSTGYERCPAERARPRPAVPAGSAAAASRLHRRAPAARAAASSASRTCSTCSTRVAGSA